MAQNIVDATEVIDRSPVGGYQIMIFTLCAFIAAFDGYDTQAIGYTAPLVVGHIGAPMSALGPIFSAGLVGATLGAFAFGPLADRFGRKWLLVVACALFALFTLATTQVSSLPELLLLRFLTGLGLGGATPSFLALGAEYAPTRHRSMVVTMLFAAFPFGGFLGGLAASFLIPAYGWQTIFLVGGVVPLLFSVLLVFGLPESLRFMLARGTGQASLRAILSRISRQSIAAAAMIVSSERRPAGGFLVGQLFTEGRAARTLMLWVPFFMGFMILLTVTAWTPALLKSTGMSLASAALILAANNLGSVAGTGLSGYFLDRFGPFRVLIPGFIAGAVSLALFGAAGGSLVYLTITSAAAGFLIGGSSAGMIALAALFYPTAIRSTGIGWGMGMGRLGQIIGPLALGAMVAQQSTVATIFLVAAGPCLIAALFILALYVYARVTGLGTAGDELAGKTVPIH